jgi:hypothetical protein
MQAESPESSAAAVLSQATAEADARKNASARPVPPLYWFGELRRLQPWQRAQILGVACARADRELGVIAACFVWLALVLVVAFVAPSGSLRVGGAIAVTAVLGLPFIVIRRSRVRRHLRELLAANEQVEVRA